MPDTTATVSARKPAGWMNAAMKLFLRTPGLQSLLGRQLALLTFTGRKSGRRITIPISYAREGDHVLVMTKRLRPWWYNFEAPAPVQIRIAGRDLTGTATAVLDAAGKAERIAAMVAGRPVDAKAYGLTLDADGRPDPAQVAALAPQVVPIVIEVEGAATG